MKKIVNFIDSDKELVDKIKEYQKNSPSSFTDNGLLYLTLLFF